MFVSHPGGRAQRRRREEQGSEVRRLTEDVTGGVHSKELVRKCEPCETAVEAILSSPGRALVIEIEAVSTRRMTDEVMDCTEPIKRTSELTAKKGMKALYDGGG